MAAAVTSPASPSYINPLRSLSLEDDEPAPPPDHIPWIPIWDTLYTDSARLQDETVDEVLPFLRGQYAPTNAHGVPHLTRELHVQFLHKQLGKLPAMFKAADPSRPWFFYWCLNALSLLGEDVIVYRERLIATIRPMQNLSGGIAGGFGQTSHLATTYASVLSLMLVGGDEDTYELINRKTMWEWLCRLKQPDGGFQIAVGGEEDVRGAYCASVIISLLDLPTQLSQESPAYGVHEGLYGGLADWVRRCQTYEGGVSAKPGVEAHGAYAFCALGCLAIVDAPHRSIPRYLDVPRLIGWLAARQYGPEGGFSGRTNKLVDGCYSHWVGGCWPLIEAALNGPAGSAANSPDHPRGTGAASSLFNRDALIRYILCCCQDQSKRGGLRDKPSKFSDAYHTCYVLSGLSAAQHHWQLTAARSPEDVGVDEWTSCPCNEDEQIFDESDRVIPLHPVYVIPHHAVDAARKWFTGTAGFFRPIPENGASN